MQILILEDEPIIAQNLTLQLKEVEPSATIMGPLASIRETLAFIANNHSPDLVLADIQLSDGVSFTALEKLPREIPIIFTTAFDEYALRAFRLNSVDYLLKPISVEDLKRAFEKFHFLQEKYQNTDFTTQLHEMLSGKINPSNYKQRFLVYSGKSVVPVSASDIEYFQKEEIIFLTDIQGHQFVTEFRSLDEIEELINPTIFYRANRQFLLNCKHIARFETDYLGKIHIYLKRKDHPEITISKDKAADFKRWMESN